MRSRAITLPRIPTGPLGKRHFAVTDVRVPSPGRGDLAIRPLILSIDPYLMMPIRSGAFPEGRIRSRLIGRVERSEAPGFVPGDLVLGFARWQERDVVAAADMRLLRPVLPLSAYLGIAGHSGFTALIGTEILDPRQGQTITISSAAGMVGMIAAQLAKAAGAEVVAIAGGAKAARVAAMFDLDGAVDHAAPDLAGRLAHACPTGIDRHFENVGARILDPVLGLANMSARIALCGLIQHYGDSAPVCLTNFRKILLNAITISPFSIYQHEQAYPAALGRLEALVLEGRLHGPETIHEGLCAIPDAFLAMLGGEGIGKHLVRIAD